MVSIEEWKAYLLPIRIPNTNKTIEPIENRTADILNGFKESKTTTAGFFDLEKTFEANNNNKSL